MSYQYANDFYDLIVYQKAYSFQQEVFNLTKSFPKEELYSLTDQIRRSSRSVGANISEAWRKRSYPKHFCSKLSDSDGELGETLHWLFTARDCGYVKPSVIESMQLKTQEIGRILGTMMRDHEKWCPQNHKYGR